LESIGASVNYPRIEFCTDNAAMVAFTGACRLATDGAPDGYRVEARPRWELPAAQASA
jgi:N6-L-threonylcarbamoyladenine synthase